MFSEIWIPIAGLGGLGLLFGIGLAIASKKLAVKVDEKEEKLKAIMPGANCGGCGFPGCEAYASALARGEAEPNLCPVGGAELVKQIAEVLGVEAEAGAAKVALVRCHGTRDLAKDKHLYHGIHDCFAASLFQEGAKACAYGCLGLGTCVRACPFDAIHVNEDSVAEVDVEKCTGCGNCADACPKHLIDMVPKGLPVMVLCHSEAKGKAVKQICDVGCIGCGLCAKVCPVDAITMVNNLPVIDPDKCIGCLQCAEKCPTHSIAADLENRKKAVIRPEDCIGCGICKKACVFDAIEGERKAPHTVDPDKCTGCGQCVEKCPKDAIDMT
jgi:electron transport complex protein RnfB